LNGQINALAVKIVDRADPILHLKDGRGVH